MSDPVPPTVLEPVLGVALLSVIFSLIFSLFAGLLGFGAWKVPTTRL